MASLYRKTAGKAMQRQIFTVENGRGKMEEENGKGKIKRNKNSRL